MFFILRGSAYERERIFTFFYFFFLSFVYHTSFFVTLQFSFCDTFLLYALPLPSESCYLHYVNLISSLGDLSDVIL